jgi:hypothetical protein
MNPLPPEMKLSRTAEAMQEHLAEFMDSFPVDAWTLTIEPERKGEGETLRSLGFIILGLGIVGLLFSFILATPPNPASWGFLAAISASLTAIGGLIVVEERPKPPDPKLIYFRVEKTPEGKKLLVNGVVVEDIIQSMGELGFTYSQFIESYLAHSVETASHTNQLEADLVRARVLLEVGDY